MAKSVRSIVLKNMKRSNNTKRSYRWECKPITLIEVCCSRTSKFARSVQRLGGAAIRVTWPPCSDRAKDWQRRWINEWRPKEDIQRRFLKASGIERGPTGWSTRDCPYSGCWRHRTWFLNIDWPVHKRALLERIQKISAVPPSTVAVLHTSPECRMFSCTQAINVARGCYSTTDHRRAMARLAYIRKLHAVWQLPRPRKRGRRISLHEQPPAARVDWGRKKKSRAARRGVVDPWPWAVGQHCPRSNVNACMVGVRGKCGRPVYKGWTFECNEPLFHRALHGFSCSRNHVHAKTKLAVSKSSVRTSSSSKITQLKTLENYPNALATLLTLSCGLRSIVQ